MEKERPQTLLQHTQHNERNHVASRLAESWGLKDKSRNILKDQIQKVVSYTWI